MISQWLFPCCNNYPAHQIEKKHFIATTYIQSSIIIRYSKTRSCKISSEQRFSVLATVLIKFKHYVSVKYDELTMNVIYHKKTQSRSIEFVVTELALCFK